MPARRVKAIFGFTLPEENTSAIEGAALPKS
jgi:hypothetical protein